MSLSAKRRLMVDYQSLQKNQPYGISAEPCDDNYLIWRAVIFGPKDTPYENGRFKALISFSNEYPNKPPTVRFVSKMFHPNVYADGFVCLDMLNEKWLPDFDVTTILLSVQCLLADPNPGSSANTRATSLFLTNKELYNNNVISCVTSSLEESSSSSH